MKRKAIILWVGSVVVCAILGTVGGRVQANRTIAEKPNRIQDVENYRKEITVYGLKGGLLWGMFAGSLAVLFVNCGTWRKDSCRSQGNV